MRKFLVLVLSMLLTAAAMPVRAASGPGPFITPPAPGFTDKERQAELARRRAAVESLMLDDSIMILLSAEPKQYTNDVDYVYRQENNLYYLTNLKQKNATLVIRKSHGEVSEMIFMPPRDPQSETWNGRMYSKDEAMRISGINEIVPSKERDNFFLSLGNKKDASIKTIYLLLPNDEGDEDGRREFNREIDLSKHMTGYAVVNAQPMFGQLRHIKSPYEQKLLQHAIDITTEAQMRAWAAAPRAKMEYE